MSAIYATERAQATRLLPICKFDARKQGLERWLGDLEAAVMEILWKADEPHTVKWVWREVSRNHKVLGYSTIMTTMTRLWVKGMLDRHKTSHAFTYYIRETRDQFEDRQIAAILASLELA